MGRPKRHILADASTASTPPAALPPAHRIARVERARGNNVFAVTLASGGAALAELAANLRSTFWIRRGAFVVVDGAALAKRDNKLAGEIVTVIMEIKRWRKMAYWPEEFREVEDADTEDDDEDEDSDVGLKRNVETPPEEDEVESGSEGE
jgi:probable RNA-binding protein EIF1AD